MLVYVSVSYMRVFACACECVFARVLSGSTLHTSMCAWCGEKFGFFQKKYKPMITNIKASVHCRLSVLQPDKKTNDKNKQFLVRNQIFSKNSISLYWLTFQSIICILIIIIFKYTNMKKKNNMEFA